MEKAILKTLSYSAVFDYPLKAWEIHKWLIGKKVTFKEVEKSLQKLVQGKKVEHKKDFYFLKGDVGLVKKRLEREKISKPYLKRAAFFANFLKLIPWIKLIGVTGSLSMGNAKKNDDIDLMLISQKNRLYLSRLFALGLLQILGKRRKKGESFKAASGKICLNILLEEDALLQSKKDIYIAHEVLQLKPLWVRDDCYSLFLEQNSWVFKFLPNWASNNRAQVKRKKINLRTNSFLNFMEILARNYQLNKMGKGRGQEKISKNALYFHPLDKREEVLKEFKQRVKKVISS